MFRYARLEGSQKRDERVKLGVLYSKTKQNTQKKSQNPRNYVVKKTVFLYPSFFSLLRRWS